VHRREVLNSTRSILGIEMEKLAGIQYLSKLMGLKAFEEMESEDYL